ncbi:MAG: AAA family ATPase [Eubacteriales bacterium]|nr:AAA family ATPase [Eubacteriales bacterium]
MNIKEAKTEVKNALLAYHRKDENGRYQYPLVRQRPLLLIGPPGIGKTAIMEQIARECGVGLVAYTITHHTRQSAIGLPKIVTRTYEGTDLSVTEYTLSEIIASVYDCMEKTGKKEGILFIDEINCVSETLAPTMLQFLQNKTFGSHKVPKGWMIVAAGNPPEYNKSVREFDIVTLDRVRKIEITADLSVWMEYAWSHDIHGAILSYLNIRQEHFYVIEQKADEVSFVTARGWEDLSEILKSYEALEIQPTENLIVQYLQKEEIAGDFAVYYQLYRKYGTDYGIAQLLNGTLSEDVYPDKVSMAKNGSFEEKFTVAGLLLDALNSSVTAFEEEESRITLLHQSLQHYKKYLESQTDMQSLRTYMEDCKKRLKVKQDMELCTQKELDNEAHVIRQLEQYDLTLRREHILDKTDGFERIKSLFQERLQQRKNGITKVRSQLERAFSFVLDCFGEEQEMILFVSGLTRNQKMTGFIGAHGCDSYFLYSQKLLHLTPEEELKDACKTLLSASEI